MAGNIKGITIEFFGDTTKLDKALRDVNDKTKGIDKELKQVNKSLKFNPGNVELLAQKQNLLTQRVDETKQKLHLLKQQQAGMDSGEIEHTEAEYRELQREIIKAENQQKFYNAELNKVKAASSSLGQAAAKMKDLGAKATAAGNALKPLSAAGAAIDVALAGLAYKSGVAADDLNTLSKVTGIGVTELQKYKAASDLVDVSVEAIAKSQTKLKKNMLSAAQGFDTLTVAEDGTVTGGNATAKAFEALGVKVTDSNGNLRDQETVFQETIAALGQMKNETERDALAMQIFGKSATELNPLIEDNGETYKKVADIFNNNELKLVDQATLDQANAFNDSIDTIKLTWSAALSQVGMQLAGYLAPAMEKIAEIAGKIAGWLSQLNPQVLTVIGIIAGVVAAIAPVLIIVGKVATGISAIMSLMSTLGVSLGAIAGPIGIVIGVIAALIAIGVLLYKNWDTIKAKATELKDWVVTKWNELKTSVVNFVTQLKDGVIQKWNELKTGVVNFVTQLKTGVIGLWTALKTGIMNIAIAITTWSIQKFLALKTGVVNAVTAIKTTVSAIWTNIKTAVVNAVNGLYTGAVAKFNALKSTASTVFNAVKTAITNPIQTAVTLIRTAINKIKGIINGAHLSLPKFKLPHFRISGGKVPWGIGGMGTKPSISVDWYKTGGIFNSPTIAGIGEAGPEAVIPLDTLWKKLDKIAESNSGGGNNVVINVHASPGMDVKALAREVEAVLVRQGEQRRAAWGY